MVYSDRKKEGKSLTCFTCTGKTLSCATSNKQVF